MGRQLLKSALNVVAGTWIGLQACVGFLVAPYLFRLAAQKSEFVPHTGAAAALIGPLLHRIDVLSVTVGAAVLAGLLLLRARGERLWGARFGASELGVAAAIGMALLNLLLVSPSILAVKERLAEKYGAYHLADKTDPLYGQFGMWHGVSTSLFLVGFLGSVVCVFCLATGGRLGTTGEVR